MWSRRKRKILKNREDTLRKVIVIFFQLSHFYFSCDLPVLSIQIPWPPRLHLLCPTQKVRPSFHAPRGPSWRPADRGLVWTAICRRRPHNLLRPAQRSHPRGHVLVLLSGSPWAPNAALPLVEALPYQATDDTIRRFLSSRPPASLYRLRISKGLLLDNNWPRGSLLCTVCQLLYEILQQGPNRGEEQEWQEKVGIILAPNWLETFSIWCKYSM